MVEVLAQGFLFRPEEIAISAGGTVLWSSEDGILHTVTSGEPERPTDDFDRELYGAGTSPSIRFDATGEYRFFCSRHRHMTGVIRVVDRDS